MATMIHAFAGEGFGHLSRARALTRLMRGRGHRIVLSAGGTAAAKLRDEGESIIEVPALVPVIRGNRLRIARTVGRNGWRAATGHDLPALAARFHEVDPDLVLVDLEPFSAVTADLLRIPTLSFGRQQILTHTRYRLTPQRRFAAPFARAAVRVLSPLRPQRVLINTLWPGPARYPHVTHLLPPLLRPAVLERTPEQGDHLLVYFNGGVGSQHLAHLLADRLAAAPVASVVYGVGRPDGFDAPNVTWKETGESSFLDDLASCRAVIASAGFNLMSEAVHFGKPLLALPNRGNLEQVVNGSKLEENGAGACAHVRAFLHDPDVLDEFLAHPPHVRATHGRAIPACPEHVAEAIERELPEPTAPPLRGRGPRTPARPPSPRPLP